MKVDLLTLSHFIHFVWLFRKMFCKHVHVLYFWCYTSFCLGVYQFFSFLTFFTGKCAICALRGPCWNVARTIWMNERTSEQMNEFTTGRSECRARRRKPGTRWQSQTPRWSRQHSGCTDRGLQTLASAQHAANYCQKPDRVDKKPSYGNTGRPTLNLPLTEPNSWRKVQEPQLIYHNCWTNKWTLYTKDRITKEGTVILARVKAKPYNRLR